jgi:predicted CXXCH cytochrome family protein
VKRSIGLVVLVALLITGAALAQTVPSKKLVIGSKHDIASAGCKSCHASHDGAKATSTTGLPSSGTILLWDRNFPTVTYGIYDSPSMQTKGIKAVEVGGTTPLATDARMNSVLCMSCHDGVTSTSVLPATDPTAIGADLPAGTGLTNDHPVNVAHDSTKDPGLATVANVTAGGLVLYGPTGTVPTVQCASCHTSHDDTIVPFLRKANTGSAVCTTCHL